MSMGLPSINIAFSNAASTAVSRSNRGVVALILKDAAALGAHVLTAASQIPTALGTDNQDYIRRAFIGYVNPPRKVIVYVEPAAATDLVEGLAFLATQVFDYFAGPPAITADECTAVKAWIKVQRALGAIPKAVLPDTAADDEAIINFTPDGIKAGSETYASAAYCSRIAGILAGTPASISCTFAPLPEVSDFTRLTKDQTDAAIGGGQLVFYYDGTQTKIARGVNSLQTTSAAKGEAYKKIKIVETMDMITSDIRTTAQDTYIGKFANTYENKCLLITAIADYFRSLEGDGILNPGSTVEIDVDAQEAWLKSQDIDTSNMTAAQIKAANTGDNVFLKATISILDAIEDITLAVTV